MHNELSALFNHASNNACLKVLKIQDVIIFQKRCVKNVKYHCFRLNKAQYYYLPPPPYVVYYVKRQSVPGSSCSLTQLCPTELKSPPPSIFFFCVCVFVYIQTEVRGESNKILKFQKIISKNPLNIQYFL